MTGLFDRLYLSTPFPRRDTFGDVWDSMILKRSWLARRMFPALRHFEIVPNDFGWTLSDATSRVMMKRNYARIFLRECNNWPRWYAGDWNGKTVLDVGAGCGETAWFFIKGGAKKVVAIEPDERCFALLTKNAWVNGWNVEPINKVFQPWVLSIPHDFLKMDCEGCESSLLTSETRMLKPCRIELHPRVIGKGNCDGLIRKFGLKKITREIYSN